MHPLNLLHSFELSMSFNFNMASGQDLQLLVLNENPLEMDMGRLLIRMKLWIIIIMDKIDSDLECEFVSTSVTFKCLKKSLQ